MIKNFIIILIYINKYLKEREFNLSKCSECKKEQPYYKFKVSGAGGPWCNIDCMNKKLLVKRKNKI